MKKAPTSSGIPGAFFFQASLVIALIGFGTYFDHVAPTAQAVGESVADSQPSLEEETLSPEVQRVAQWAIASQDHAGLPFIVVDKPRARLFAFDSQGRFLGTNPVVVGVPAGEFGAPDSSRFIAEAWKLADDGGIVLTSQSVDAAFMHVPGEFYRDYLVPLTMQPSIGYLLPDALALQEVWRSDDFESWFSVALAQWRTPPRRPS